jgi:hypothetical protein
MVVVSKHLKLALLWIGLLDTKNFDGMASVLSDNFLWTGRPKTLGIPQLDKQGYISAFRAAPFQYFNVSPGGLFDLSYTN